MNSSKNMSKRIDMLKTVASRVTMAQRHAAIAYNHKNIISIGINSKENPAISSSTQREHISCHAEEAVLRSIPRRLLLNQRKKGNSRQKKRI